MIDEGLAEYGLRIAAGADYAEIRMESVEGDSITLSNGVVEGSEIAEKKGIAVRVLVNGAMGFHATNITGREGMKRAVERAMKTASLQKRKERMELSDEKAHRDRWEVNGRPSPDIDEKISYLKSLDDTAKDTLSRLFFYGEERAEKYYTNTDGAEIRSVIPRMFLYYLITVTASSATQGDGNSSKNGTWEKRWKAT